MEKEGRDVIKVFQYEVSSRLTQHSNTFMFYRLHFIGYKAAPTARHSSEFFSHHVIFTSETVGSDCTSELRILHAYSDLTSK